MESTNEAALREANVEEKLVNIYKIREIYTRNNL